MVIAENFSKRLGEDGASFIRCGDVAGIMTGSGQVGPMQDGEVLLNSEAGGAPAAGAFPSAAPALGSSYSRFVQRLRRRYAAELSLLPAGAPDKASMAGVFKSLRDGG